MKRVNHASLPENRTGRQVEYENAKGVVESNRTTENLCVLCVEQGGLPLRSSLSTSKSTLSLKSQCGIEQPWHWIESLRRIMRLNCASLGSPSIPRYPYVALHSLIYFKYEPFENTTLAAKPHICACVRRIPHLTPRLTHFLLHNKHGDHRSTPRTNHDLIHRIPLRAVARHSTDTSKGCIHNGPTIITSINNRPCLVGRAVCT